MIIGSISENKDLEKRVSITPDLVKKYISLGFKVLIERDSTMGYRGRRKPYGSNTSSVYNIYFPRVSYRRTSSKEQIRKEKDFFSEGRNFSGSRRAHIRRLPEGSKPAKLQLILARKQSIEVPFGYTFVQKSMWGDKTMPVREKRYRTRSLHGIFYYTKKEVSEAEKIVSKLKESGIRARMDARDIRPGQKYYDWEIKGVPLRIEIGPRDIENNKVILSRRDIDNSKDIQRAKEILL